MVYGETAVDAEVETCFSFCDKVNLGMSGYVVGDEPSPHGRLPQFRLLRSLPSVRMAEDKIDAGLYRGEQTRPITVGLGDKLPEASVEIAQHVGEDIFRLLSEWKWLKIRLCKISGL